MWTLTQTIQGLCRPGWEQKMFLLSRHFPRLFYFNSPCISCSAKASNLNAIKNMTNIFMNNMLTGKGVNCWSFVHWLIRFICSVSVSVSLSLSFLFSTHLKRIASLSGFKFESARAYSFSSCSIGLSMFMNEEGFQLIFVSRCIQRCNRRFYGKFGFQ